VATATGEIPNRRMPSSEQSNLQFRMEFYKRVESSAIWEFRQQIARRVVEPSQPRRRLMVGTAYCLNASGDPLTRFSLRWKFTSTWSAILMNGIPLFIP
jgi:hypothetical protein